jgi:hypothetical protein
MKLTVIIGLALVFVNVEAGLLHIAGVTLVKVDAGAIFIAFMALDFMPLEGAVGAFFIGYFQDVLCGRPTGLYEFLAVLVFLLVRVAAAAVDIRGVVGFSLMAALASGVGGTFSFAMTYAASANDKVPGPAALAAVVPTAFWTALFAAPLFLLLRKVESRFSREDTGMQLP